VIVFSSISIPMARESSFSRKVGCIVELGNTNDR
jgi:hypothetical protein